MTSGWLSPAAACLLQRQRPVRRCSGSGGLSAAAAAACPPLQRRWGVCISPVPALRALKTSDGRLLPSLPSLRWVSPPRQRRAPAVEKLLESPTNYKQECLKIGQTAWLEQCRKVSRKNIYDGQYAVKVTVKKPATIQDSEEDRSFEARISTFLFIAALEDAKDLITAQILKRRNEQQTKAAEDRALRDKQREVDERASHSDSTKLLLEELGNMRGQMNKCLSVLDRDVLSKLAMA